MNEKAKNDNAVTTDTENAETITYFVDTQDSLIRLADHLMEQPRVAVDTESNSMHAYREQVCLIQMSIPGQDFLIDPFALDSLQPLAPFFASERIEKIFHAADYDLIVMKRDFGFHCGKLFDTMWAARVLGWPDVGLADILETYFDHHANKRYQRYDWGKRPLDPNALWYARMDSHYLIALRNLQADALREMRRWQEAQEIFTYLTETVDVPPLDRVDDFFWRIKGRRNLRHYDQRVLYALHLWRDRVAERTDRPLGRVISNRRLVKVARIQPRNFEELNHAGLSRWQIRRFGREILNVLRRNPPELPSPPAHTRPPIEVTERYKMLKSWRKEIAAMRGVDSDIILPNAVLWKLAKSPPDSQADLIEITGIGPWRRERYGSDLLDLTSN